MTFRQKINVLRQRLQNLYWDFHGSRKYRARQAAFQNSQSYWEQRYKEGGTSGSGSYGKLMEFKAGVINRFVEEHNVNSVIEFGCGDGNQLLAMHYPTYLGLDVSETAISRCRDLFKEDSSKKFKNTAGYSNETADLSLSLDVIYHLVEDAVYENYMKTLFSASTRFVIIYSSNQNIVRKGQGRHVKHRRFTEWIDENLTSWQIVKKIENKHPFTGQAGEGSHADFYIYEKKSPCLALPENS